MIYLKILLQRANNSKINDTNILLTPFQIFRWTSLTCCTKSSLMVNALPHSIHTISLTLLWRLFLCFSSSHLLTVLWEHSSQKIVFDKCTFLVCLSTSFLVDAEKSHTSHQQSLILACKDLM